MYEVGCAMYKVRCQVKVPYTSYIILRTSFYLFVSLNMIIFQLRLKL